MPAEPFSALTFIGAPALLTNATSVLILSTANRLGRSVTRARELARQIAADADGSDTKYLVSQLQTAERRVLVTVRAVTALYLAIGAFAAGTLAAFIGAFGADEAEQILVRAAIAVTIAAGALGFVALVTGASMLVYESQLAYRMLRQEADRVLSS